MAQNNQEQNIYIVEVIDDVVSKRVIKKIEVPIEEKNINKREKVEME